jgi:hypothetical protein
MYLVKKESCRIESNARATSDVLGTFVQRGSVIISGKKARVARK